MIWYVSSFHFNPCHSTCPAAKRFVTWWDFHYEQVLCQVKCARFSHTVNTHMQKKHEGMSVTEVQPMQGFAGQNWYEHFFSIKLLIFWTDSSETCGCCSLLTHFLSGEMKSNTLSLMPAFMCSKCRCVRLLVYVLVLWWTCDLSRMSQIRPKKQFINYGLLWQWWQFITWPGPGL